MGITYWKAICINCEHDEHGNATWPAVPLFAIMLQRANVFYCYEYGYYNVYCAFGPFRGDWSIASLIVIACSFLFSICLVRKGILIAGYVQV